MLRKYEKQWIEDNKNMLYVGVPILLFVIIILGVMLQIPK